MTSKILRYFTVLCLGVLLLVTVDFFFLGASLLRYAPGDLDSFYWTQERKLSESEKLLRSYYTDTEGYTFAHNGWSLREIG